MTDEELRHYSAALDEIWRLRTALAYEAHVISSRLANRPAPKSGKSPAQHQVDRMRSAARGDADSHEGIPSRVKTQARYLADMDGLTRWQWENR
jgi:hypothetical protein